MLRQRTDFSRFKAAERGHAFFRIRPELPGGLPCTQKTKNHSKFVILDKKRPDFLVNMHIYKRPVRCYNPRDFQRKEEQTYEHKESC